MLNESTKPLRSFFALIKGPFKRKKIVEKVSESGLLDRCDANEQKEEPFPFNRESEESEKFSIPPCTSTTLIAQQVQSLAIGNDAEYSLQSPHPSRTQSVADRDFMTDSRPQPPTPPSTPNLGTDNVPLAFRETLFIATDFDEQEIAKMPLPPPNNVRRRGLSEAQAEQFDFDLTSYRVDEENPSEVIRGILNSPVRSQSMRKMAGKRGERTARAGASDSSDVSPSSAPARMMRAPRHTVKLTNTELQFQCGANANVSAYRKALVGLQALSSAACVAAGAYAGTTCCLKLRTNWTTVAEASTSTDRVVASYVLAFATLYTLLAAKQCLGIGQLDLGFIEKYFSPSRSSLITCMFAVLCLEVAPHAAYALAGTSLCDSLLSELLKM